VGLAVLCGSFAASASAAVPGLQRITASSPTNSLNKLVNATCPVGKRLIGAGGDITGGGGQVVIDDLSPNPALTSVRVAAVEDQTGATAKWSVRAYAICADPVAGLQLISASVNSNSVTGSDVSAVCPAGKKVLGAGGELTAAGGQVVMDDILPDPALASVRVTGFEDGNGTASNWNVRAFAICANPLPGLQRIIATTVSNSVTGSRATAVCPAGKKLTGTGGDFTGALGEVVMDDITPSATLTSLTVTGAEDESGAAANWTVHSYAICATA
jgi:hypothetical protein